MTAASRYFQLQPIHRAHRAEHVGRIATLAAPSGKQRPAARACARARELEDGVEEPALRAMREQPSAKLTQDRVVEAHVREVEREQVLPVDPGADGVGRLAIGERFHELQEGHQGKSARRFSRAPPHREQVGEVAVADNPGQRIRNAHDEIAGGEDRPRDASRLLGNRVRLQRLQRQWTPRARLNLYSPTCLGSRQDRRLGGLYG